MVLWWLWYRAVQLIHIFSDRPATTTTRTEKFQEVLTDLKKSKLLVVTHHHWVAPEKAWFKTGHRIWKAPGLAKVIHVNRGSDGDSYHNPGVPFDDISVFGHPAGYSILTESCQPTKHWFWNCSGGKFMIQGRNNPLLNKSQQTKWFFQKERFIFLQQQH